MEVVGGYRSYGQPLGVLLLDARYPRLPGDCGHASTYARPVRFHVVPGLRADELIHHYHDEIGDRVLAQALGLVREGVKVIAGGCGFFAVLQERMRRELPVPFLTSSLVQVPWLRRVFGGRIGVLTIDEAALTDDYVGACGWSRSDPDVVVEGVDPDGTFARVYFENRDRFDPEDMARDLLDAAARLSARTPDLRAVVLECTNMAPFAWRIQAALGGVPVFDIQLLADFFTAAAERTPYD